MGDIGSNKGESGLNFGSLVQLQNEYHEPSLQLSNIVQHNDWDYNFSPGGAGTGRV